MSGPMWNKARRAQPTPPSTSRRTGENDVERDIGMLGEEARQQRHHVLHAEGNIAVHHQMPARRCAGAGLALGLLDLAEDTQRALVEGLAFLSQLELAR